MVIAAMVGNTGEVHIVNIRNNGAIPDLPFGSAVEVQASIDARGATALVQQLKAYEQLTVQAAVSGDRQTAIWALVNNPLVGSYVAATEIFDRLLEAHRQYLPAFA